MTAAPVIPVNWALDFVELPYRRRLTWSDMAETSALMALLRVTDIDGAVGAAEITIKPTWNGLTIGVLHAAIDELLFPIIKGQDVSNANALFTLMNDVPENTVAKGLVDNAIWDLRAARSGQPLWQLWESERRVELSWAVTRQAPPAMADEALEMIGMYGFRTLKIKGGQGVDKDIQVISAIRDAVGEDVSLYVDANGAYSAETAVDYCRLLCELAITHIEDPYPLIPDSAFEKLQKNLDRPIIIDFPCHTTDTAEAFLDRGARAISIKPGRTGATAALKIARKAADYGAQTHIGLFGESAAGMRPSLALSGGLAKHPSGLPAETGVFLMQETQILKEPLTITDGRAELSATTTLAEAIDWKLVEHLGR